MCDGRLMEPIACVALVEDDDDLREDILLPGLRASGLVVEGFRSPIQLYRRMVSTAFDVVVLDVGLPDEDGLSVARHLRAGSPLGIIMLTGRGQTEHLQALGEAADAWLAKPVDVAVVAVTIISLVRRMRMPAAFAKAASAEAVASAWRLSTQGWSLAAPAGREVALSRSERAVLECLFAARGEPVSRESLIEALGENPGEFDPHRIDMLIHRLRRKSQEQLGERLPLNSVRGKGYVLIEAG